MKIYLKKAFHLVFGLASLTVLSCAFSKDKKGCEQFKSGRFKFHPKGSPDDFYFSIQRNDSTQIEFDKNSGRSAKYSIKWTEECKYELLLLEISYSRTDAQNQISKTNPMKTEIISWANDYYVFRTTRDDTNLVLVDTMWVEK